MDANTKKNHAAITATLTKRLTAAGVSATEAALIVAESLPITSYYFTGASGGALTHDELDAIESGLLARSDVKRARLAAPEPKSTREAIAAGFASGIDELHAKATFGAATQYRGLSESEFEAQKYDVREGRRLATARLQAELQEHGVTPGMACSIAHRLVHEQSQESCFDARGMHTADYERVRQAALETREIAEVVSRNAVATSTSNVGLAAQRAEVAKHFEGVGFGGADLDLARPRGH